MSLVLVDLDGTLLPGASSERRTHQMPVAHSSMVCSSPTRSRAATTRLTEPSLSLRTSRLSSARPMPVPVRTEAAAPDATWARCSSASVSPRTSGTSAGTTSTSPSAPSAVRSSSTRIPDPASTASPVPRRLTCSTMSVTGVTSRSSFEIRSPSRPTTTTTRAASSSATASST